MTTPHAGFDSSWLAAQKVAEEAAALGQDVVLARDLLGRSSLLIDDIQQKLPSDSPQLNKLRVQFAEATRPFTGVEPVQTAHSMFAPELFFDAPELTEVKPRADGVGRLCTLERTVVGTDWLQRDDDSATGTPGSRRNRRVALYGFKGGVGRSTATAVLARHLADLGRCVLVVDLDLESPGVSNLLSDEAGRPQHGIVDHLVEAAVSNADSLELVGRASLLNYHGNGEVFLAPACGLPLAGQPYNYLSKLNRIYTDLPATGESTSPRPFAVRLEQAVAACEDQVERLARRPDHVLLDSRAGIHDIAAVTLTRLSGLALLFAVDNPSTWEGYRMLLSEWQRRPDRARELRERIRIVGAMFHSAGDTERLGALRRHAYDLFMDTLYNLPDENEDEEEPFYSPDGDVDDAPYAAIPILFGNDLVGLDPLRSRRWPELPFVEAAYSKFTTAVERLLPEPHEDA
ncbi:P-loop NTPase [Streptomyces sp. ACA25]|uniref:KGGVGR-motif variant AAA ATPase n=1 Tax=Streptomyces sp. ACA25 TaxID=3022596 RepID=UPI00230778FA|nr:P-loop NTPase [Streptomyces sp. ACA25]MDB1088774.1 P-loop NTPase [Streptomyces sp. ACA25]